MKKFNYEIKKKRGYNFKWKGVIVNLKYSIEYGASLVLILDLPQYGSGHGENLSNIFPNMDHIFI